MKILVLNCGSSSIKYQLLDIETKTVLAKGGIEKIGLEGSFLKFNLPDGEKETIFAPIPEHTTGVRMIIDILTSEKWGVVDSIEDIDAVGHRMVHGGEKFSASTLLTDEVLEVFEACNDLAPLHNPANLKGVNAVKAVAPEIPQVGVFDTAFHQTMPDYAYMYALPYELYEQYGVRRYGFHGTSHRYITKRALEMLNIPAEGTKIITCHIGNGASVAAVKDGKSVDTSMGMTPLAGLMMGTRSGDVDPGILPYIMEKTGLDIQGAIDMLNKKSGVAGITGISSDMREVKAAADAGNERAILSNTMNFYRIKKYIGAYAAAMGGVDIIIFAGGVGENQQDCREAALEGLEFLGVELDKEVNAKMRGEEAVLSTPNSRVKVLLVPTDEELMIASDTYDIVKAMKK
ncbi:MAG: acetate kinase [Bacteroidaceae bacterium]|nr:acetate kinase [Bacteroidaceae bacterium]